MKARRVIVADFDSWTGFAVSAEGVSPLRVRDTLKYVLAYLKCGRGSFRKRLISSAIKLFASRLKPLHAPLKCGHTTSPEHSMETSWCPPHSGH